MIPGGGGLSPLQWRPRRTRRLRLRFYTDHTSPPLDRRSRGQMDASNARRADQSIIIVAFVILFVTAALLLWAVADVVLLVFGGVLLSIFLRSLSEALSGFARIPEGWALALVVLVLAAVPILGGVFFGAEAASQLGELAPRLQQAWEGLLEYLYSYEWGKALLGDNRPVLPGGGNGDLLSRIAGVFSTTIGAIAAVLVVLFIGLYVAAAPRMYRQGLLLLVPPRTRDRAGDVLDAIGTTLRWWLVGTFVKMVIIGVFITTGLVLLDIPLALALGLLAFALEFVPYIGPILASIPALLVGLSVGPLDAAYVLALYLVVQLTEGYVVSPLIDQRAVRLPPAVAIVSQVFLGVTLGALGAVFAAPLAATALVLVNMLYVEDWLGDAPGASVLGPRPPR